MLDESMFEDIHEIAENSAYLKAVEQKDVSLEMLEQLPPYAECRDIEERLRMENKLTFEAIFNEATGFYMIKSAHALLCTHCAALHSTLLHLLVQCVAMPRVLIRFPVLLPGVCRCFLIADYAVDKAIFIKDVEAYKSMRFESARRKVAALLYQRFVSTDEHDYKHGMSVFQIIQQSKGAEEKKERDGKVQPASINLSSSPSHAQSLDLKTIIPPSSPLHSTNAASTIHNATVVNGHSVTLTTNNGANLPTHLNGHLSSPPPYPHPHSAASSTNLSQSAPPITPSSPSHAASTLLQMGTNNNSIGVYGKSVRVVREKVQRGEAPKDLFDEVARDVMTDLKLDAFPRFKQSPFFQRYIRTKWIETQKVQVKDFTTFRVLGRGGFGAVHACRKKNSGQIYAMKCFPACDVRVLTNRGFLFLDELQVAMKGGDVRFASYDVATHRLVYGPGELVLPPGRQHRLINVTPASEQRRWAPGSGRYGTGLREADKSRCNPFSLRVTADHHLYVQCGNELIAGDEESIAWARRGELVAPPTKVEANQLLQTCNCAQAACSHRTAHARFLGVAAQGVAVDSEEDCEVERMLAAALGLTAEQVDPFLELYGFWLGEGHLSHARRRPAVIFSQVKTEDVQWLRSLLHSCGLHDACWSDEQRDEGTHTLCIHHSSWIAFFDSEYGEQGVKPNSSASDLSIDATRTVGRCLSSTVGVIGSDGGHLVEEQEEEESEFEPFSSPCSGFSETSQSSQSCQWLDGGDLSPPPSPSHCSSEGDDSTSCADERWTECAKWFMGWVLRQLGMRRLRLILSGLHRAHGTSTDGANDLCTSSTRFRDELMVVLLHAGYSTHFDLEHEAGAIIGHRRIGQPGRLHTAEDVTHAPHLYRPVRAMTECWRVHWSAPSSVAGQRACWPVVRCHDGVRAEEYSGRVWCVTVQHRDHLVVAQRASRDASGRVTKASAPVIVGQCVNKKLVKVKSALDNVLEERNVLTMMKSHFVTNLKYGLQDEDTLYLIMDLMLGGDLKFHLINAGRFTEKRARFYAAQVLLGLEHVHKLSIIYRDMKLENVLLDHQGHCRLSDLGLAVVTKVKIKGYAGTPGYCFTAADHELLTASGFMNLDQVTAHFRSQAELQVACWVDGVQEFHAITADKVTVAEETFDLVTFSSAAHAVSLRVTAGHRMFGCLGAVTEKADGSLPWLEEDVPALRDVTARQVVASGHGSTPTVFEVRTSFPLGSAAVGVVDVWQLPFVKALGLVTEDHIAAFLWLYGYWLGDGWLEGGNACIAFGSIKPQAWDALDAVLARLPLPKLQNIKRGALGYWRATNLTKGGQRNYYICAEAWWQYFGEQYGHKYAGKYAAEAARAGAMQRGIGIPVGRHLPAVPAGDVPARAVTPPPSPRTALGRHRGDAPAASAAGAPSFRPPLADITCRTCEQVFAASTYSMKANQRRALKQHEGECAAYAAQPADEQPDAAADRDAAMASLPPGLQQLALAAEAAEAARTRAGKEPHQVIARSAHIVRGIGDYEPLTAQHRVDVVYQLHGPKHDNFGAHEDGVLQSATFAFMEEAMRVAGVDYSAATASTAIYELLPIVWEDWADAELRAAIADGGDYVPVAQACVRAVLSSDAKAVIAFGEHAQRRYRALGAASVARIGPLQYYKVSRDGRSLYVIEAPHPSSGFGATIGVVAAAMALAQQLAAVGDGRTAADDDKVRLLATTAVEAPDAEGITSAKWYWYWVWRLLPSDLRTVLAGQRFADGTEVEQAVHGGALYTSSVRHRDEVVRLCLAAGYSAFYHMDKAAGTVAGVNKRGKPIILRHDSWCVRYTDSAQQVEPKLRVQRDARLEEAVACKVWCVTVPAKGNLIMVRRVLAHGAAGQPSAVSRPLVIGNTAPEMIKNKLYGPAADIFSYGVMLYRMLCGSKPFKGKVDRDLDKAVIERKPTFPKEIFSKEAISLLTGLLQKRPENRLGCGERGIEEVKEHPFFESIDWGLLEAGYIDPPFVPNKFDVNAQSLKDIGDFDRAKYKHVKLDERFKQRIKNFEYVNVVALQEEMVQVLEKADENINFEKFAQQPHPVQQPQPANGPACCTVA